MKQINIDSRPVDYEGMWVDALKRERFSMM